MFRSARMRASTGNAVIDMATPRNRANARKLDGPSVHHVVLGVQIGREQEAEAERQDDRDQRDRDRDLLPALDEREVHLEPDEEHEEDDPELGQDVEVGPDVGREQQCVQVAREEPEQARAEHDARDDLADDGRLPHLDGETSHQPGQHDDHRQVDEDVGDDLRDRASSTRTPRRRGACAARLRARGTCWSGRWGCAAAGGTRSRMLALSGRRGRPRDVPSRVGTTDSVGTTDCLPRGPRGRQTDPSPDQRGHFDAPGPHAQEDMDGRRRRSRSSACRDRGLPGRARARRGQQRPVLPGPPAGTARDPG